MKQTKLFKNIKLEYGGALLNTRKGRSGPRPLDTKNTMHLVLRSSKAKGDWSFLKPDNKRKIKAIIEKFSNKYFIQVLSIGNVGNHIHFHIKLSSRFTYKPFIRAITSAIATAVTGRTRWTLAANNKLTNAEPKHTNDLHQPKDGRLPKIPDQQSSRESQKQTKWKFWDLRPFTRVIVGYKNFLNLKNYIKINQIEAQYDRAFAELVVKGDPYIDKLLSG